MKDEYIWKSRIANHLKGFMDNMRISGYKYKVPERWLKQFDQCCFENDISESTLSRDIVEGFCYGDGFESKATQQDRMCLLRKLAGYMEKSGCSVYLPPLPEKYFRYPKHEPYIYTEKELKDLFTQIDNWEQPHQSHSNRKTVDPVLFRMLYGCGLRITEALHLTVRDVDLDEGVLRIRQAKNNKDRFVPMAESLTTRCKEYSRIMHISSTSDSYFFPGFYGGCYDQSTIYVRFRQYLWQAGISHFGSGPRVHDLRYPNLNKIQTFFKDA